MQSAFVDIGLDGDAFLYVSDVFENLEDYDHGHAQEHAPAAVADAAGGVPTVEVLPGETIGRLNELPTVEPGAEQSHAEFEHHSVRTHLEEQNPELRAWMKRRQKTSASRIRTSPPRRISRLATTPPSTARHQVTLPVAIGALTEAATAVETVAQIEAAIEAATGNTSEAAAAEDVLAEEAEDVPVAAAISVKAAGTCPRQSMLRQVVRTVVAIAAIQTVARRIVGRGATLTTAVRTPPPLVSYGVDRRTVCVAG